MGEDELPMHSVEGWAALANDFDADGDTLGYASDDPVEMDDDITAFHLKTALRSLDYSRKLVSA